MIIFATLTSIFAIFILYIMQYKNYQQKHITNPDQALTELLTGNKKYNSFWNFIKKANRKSVANIQKPFAIILSCSDSRVPTEIIFNQLDLGSLFIIRNAGNVTDGVVLGTLEYGIDQLKAVLLIVLGHERCGAVTATIDSIISQSPEQQGHVKDIIKALTPAAKKILQKYDTSQPINEKIKTEIINQTIQENVKMVLHSLPKKSEIIKQAAEQGKIKIVGAYYDLDDGNVKILETY